MSAGHDRSGRFVDALLGAMLLVGLAGLGLLSGRWSAVGACGVAVVVAAAWPWRRYALDRGMHLAYLALPFLILARAWPVKERGLDLSLSFHQGLFLTTVGALVLAGPRGPHRAARVLLLSGISLSAAGTEIAHATYGALVTAWAALALVAPRLERRALPAAPEAPRGPRPATVAVALAAALMTVVGVRVIDAIYDDVDRAVMRLLRRAPLSSPGGFSGRAELGSVVDLQASGGDTVAVRAFGPRAPGYLRARVFVAYERGRWATSDPHHREAVRRQSEDGRYVLAGKRETGGDPTWRVHPSGRYGLHVFLPLETAVLSGAAPALDVWPGETFVWREGGSSSGYDVHADAAPVAWREDAASPSWLALPDDPPLLAALDEVLRARGLTPVAPDDPGAARAAVERLRSWFAARYRYHVGIQLDPSRDPVEQFLREKDAGHCELFASAGTLLLRRLGVPARYTTGFVCEEKNAWSELWLARNKHAHAWIEALDPERGWQTVEFTPAAGVPAPQPPGGVESFLDAVGGLWERVKAALLSLDLKALLLLLLSGIAGVVNWLLAAWWRAALVVLVLGVLAVRAWRRRRARAAPARALPADLERDRAKLRRLERALARLGLGRDASETLLEWAARLEAAPVEVPDRAASVTFVRDYAARRYAPRAT